MKKKLIISILLIGVLFTPKIMIKENKYSQFTKETQEWMLWYDSLSNEERKCISYVPSEIIEAIDNGFEYKALIE